MTAGLRIASALSECGSYLAIYQSRGSHYLLCAVHPFGLLTQGKCEVSQDTAVLAAACWDDRSEACALACSDASVEILNR